MSVSCLPASCPSATVQSHRLHLPHPHHPTARSFLVLSPCTLCCTLCCTPCTYSLPSPPNGTRAHVLYALRVQSLGSFPCCWPLPSPFLTFLFPLASFQAPPPPSSFHFLSVSFPFPFPSSLFPSSFRLFVSRLLCFYRPLSLTLLPSSLHEIFHSFQQNHSNAQPRCPTTTYIRFYHTFDTFCLCSLSFRRPRPCPQPFRPLSISSSAPLSRRLLSIPRSTFTYRHRLRDSI